MDQPNLDQWCRVSEFVSSDFPVFTSPGPPKEDSENTGGLVELAPVFLFSFTAIGMTTVEAARVHVRIRARNAREARQRAGMYLGYDDLTLVEIVELASNPSLS